MSDVVTDFDDLLAVPAAKLEIRLSQLLSHDACIDEITRPERLVQAMRYAVLNGGKRLRPFLVMESARLLCADTTAEAAALDVAAALECIHCYSLVHDDLPAMDDDAMRRGLPTVHLAFDEATAILVGDALLTLAFDILCAETLDITPARKVAILHAMARAAGLGGMVGGQMLDLQAETAPPDESGIIRLQAMKTGALIRFACEAGALITGATPENRQRLRQFGEAIGLAFQLADDLLDLTADAADLGKATGKDAGRGKATLVALHGPEWAEQQLACLVTSAEELLAPYGERAAVLLQAARFVAQRQR